MTTKLRKTLSVLVTFVILVTSISLDTKVYANEGGTNVDIGSGVDIEVGGDEEGGEEGGTQNVNVTVTHYHYHYFPDSMKQKYLKVNSANNRVANSKYRPKAEDLLKHYNFESTIKNKLGVTHVDMSNFDYNYKDVIKDANSTSRALEILGYDFLVRNETYTNGYKFEPVIDGEILPSTAIMNVYRALDMPIYNLHLFNKTQDTSIDNPTDSPIYDDDALEKFTAELFVTRTTEKDYVTKFKNDNPTKIIYNYKEPMLTKDFLVLVSRMMDFYGEPVMSELEMNKLLQVYGSDVPLHMSQKYVDAYVYLRSRGIIDRNLILDGKLDVDTMVDILMRVKDKDSRTDFKNIQVTYDVTEELVNKGFFGKEADVGLSQQPDSEESIDYSKATHKDLLLRVDEVSMFKDSTGSENRNIFISNEGKYHSEPIKNAYYMGIVNGYYHFKIPKETKGVVYVNSSQPDDYPLHIKLSDISGGFYEEAVDKDGIIVYNKRNNFTERDDPFLVDDNRLNVVNKSAKVGFIEGVLNLFAVPVYAEEPEEETETYTSPSLVKTISNVGVKLYEEIDAIYGSVIELEHANNILRISYNDFNSDIATEIEGYIASKTISDSIKSKVVTNIYGDVLIDYKDAYKLVSNRELENNFIPTIKEDILVLDIPNVGTVKLDNRAKKIYVNSVIYKLPDTSTLFSYTDGRLLVDFRTVYGYTGVDFIITPNNTGGHSITMMSQNNPNKNVYKGHLSLPDGNTIYSSINTRVYNNSSTKYVLSGTNPTSNYVMYTEVDSDTSDVNTYLYVYYIDGVFTKPDLLVEHSVVADDIGQAPDLSSSFDVRKIDLTNITEESNTPGTFSFEKDVGYVYNMPVMGSTDTSGVEDLTTKYYSGELPLPYYTSGSHYVSTLNVNQGSGTYTTVKPAPIGIPTYFGPELDSSNYVINDSTFDSGIHKILHGTMIVTKDYYNSISPKEGMVFKKLNSPQNSYLSLTTKDLVYIQGDKEPSTNTIISDADGIEVFGRFEDFSFDMLIRGIDWFLSFLYIAALAIAPLLMFIGLSFLLLFGYLATFKHFRMFCDRVVDPIRFLTNGHYNVHTIVQAKVFIGLIIALIVCGLVLNRTLLDLTTWLLVQYNRIIQIIK